MPQILPMIVIGAAAAIGTTTALVIGTIVAVGLTLVTARNMSGIPSTPNPVGTTYQTNPLELTFQADAPRRMVYGKARVSGVVSYANISGEGYENLWMVVIIAAHQIHSVTEIYFNGVAGPEAADGAYEYWVYDGTQTAADPTLMSLFPEYTFECVLKGCAYAVVKLTYDKEVYKNGRPNIQFDVKGKMVYDPRDGLTKWSNNAALCTADFMTYEDGLAATSAEMDWTTVAAAADVSAQIPDGMSADLCDGRYTIDGVVELTTKNGDTISQMLAALAGTVVWTEGKYRLFAGAARTPVARVITEDDLRDSPTLQPRTPTDQSFNSVKGTFLDSTNSWTFSDFPPVVGAEYVTQDGGIQQFKDIVLNFTTSPLTAQRLATIFLRRARLEKTITLPLKWTCFNYEVWDVVQLNLPQLGWISKQFQITDWKMMPPSRNEAGGIELVLVEYSDEIYSDDMDLKPIDGGGVIVVPDVTQAKPLPVLYATSGITAIEPGTGKPRIRFDWPVSTDIYTVGYEIAYGKYPFVPTDADYIGVAGRNTYYFMTPALAAGDTYIGYVRTVNSFDKRSSATPSNTVVVTGVGSEYPETLVGLTFNVVDGTYGDLTWSPPAASNSPAVKTVIMWAPTIDDFPTAVLVANVNLPSTTLRVTREIEDGYYFAAFVSNGGLIGGIDNVAAAGRTPATLLQSLTFEKELGDSTGLVWVSETRAVSDSQSNADELGWEVFDMMVPNPVAQCTFYRKSATYKAAPAALRALGSVGWVRSPNVPGTLPVLNATAQVAHFASTEYKQGTFTLSEDANIKMGFTASISDPQGALFIGLTATLEEI